MLITRHTVMNKGLFKFVKVLSKCIPFYSSIECLSYLMNLVEVNPYSIFISCKENILTIKYKSSEYSMQDYFNETKKVFGNGRSVITKAYKDKLLTYNYINGFNTYTIKVEGDKEFSEVYCMQGKLNDNSMRIYFDVMRKTDDLYFIHDWSDIFKEVFCNLAYYTNIKYKKKSVAIIILGVLKNGIQKKREKISFIKQQL